MDWLKQNKKLALESAFVVGLVCVAALAGNREGTPVKQSLEVSVETAAETAPETVPEKPVLSEKQEQLLSEIEQPLEEGNLEAAARILIEKEQQFVSLFYTTMEGQDYLYRDGALSKEIEGKGLVFQKPGTLFYGTFQNGLPEGSLTALQAIDLDAARYDYSIGSWKAGYMEGEGIIGYRYLDGAGEEVPKEVKKSGNFSEDLMSGPVLYTSVGHDDKELVWNIEAARGMTVLSDQWIYNENEDAYQLVMESDPTAVYSLKKQEAETIRWLNLIPWAR